MTDETDSLTIAEFEHVSAGQSVTLLRVRAAVSEALDEPRRRPDLVAEHPGGLGRFAPLPSPPDPLGVLRAAYSVPVTLVAPDTRFALEFDGGAIVILPAPTAGAARRPVASERAESDPAALSARLAELEIWTGELERRLTDATDQLADARARLIEAELDALSTRAEAEARQRAARELAEARRRA